VSLTGKSTFNPQKGSDRIEWSQYTWNTVVGCKGAKGDDQTCSYCYAEYQYNRFMKDERYAGRPFTEPIFHPERLDAPKNTKLPVNPNERHVFTGSMTDLFGDWVPEEWINYTLQAIWDAPEWTFILLTKNPKRLPSITFPPNAWVGTTVDVQARAQAAQEAFRNVKASVKFLSCEPLQEAMTFSDLSMFDWMIIGGRSRAGMPEFKPPQAWVDALVHDARAFGLKIYQKPNLGVATRLREYPANCGGTKLDEFV
jgi:protein gp37